MPITKRPRYRCEKIGAFRWLAAAVLTSLLIVTPSLSFARSGEGKQDHGGEFISRHAEELGLSEETRVAIREAISTSRVRGEELRFELDEAHRRLKFMLTRDQPIEAEVMEQAEKIGQIRIEESKHRLGTLLAIRSQLTPEQRAKLEEIRARSPEESVIADLARACDGDVAKLCPDTARGPERMRCMREHRDEISDSCRAALEAARQDGHRRSDGRPARRRP
jgi:Spy/CpxP family protein refolding chaperone